MTALIIETSNFLVMLLAAFGVYSVVSWNLNNKITEDNRQVIVAWVWIFGAVGITAGWFAVSRHLAPADVPFNPTMYEWRWAMKIIEACAFSWGMLKFIGMIEGYDNGKLLSFFAIFAAVAIFMGVA